MHHCGCFTREPFLFVGIFFCFCCIKCFGMDKVELAMKYRPFFRQAKSVIITVSACVYVCVPLNCAVIKLQQTFKQGSIPSLFVYVTENSWTYGCSLAGQISVRQLQKKLPQWNRDTPKGRQSCRRNWQRAGNSMLLWRTNSAWH